MKTKPYMALWNLTDKCNLKCKHCSLDFNKKSNDLTYEQAKKIVDLLSNYGFFMISFGGGEPLVVPYFKELLKYTSNKKINSIIATNGILLDQEEINFYENHGVSAIAISLDSYIKDKHEEIRGKNTFDKTVEGISLVQKSNMGLIVSIAINDNNYEGFEHLINYIRELGAEKVKIQIVIKKRGNKYELDLNKVNRLNLINSCQDLIAKGIPATFFSFTCYANHHAYKINNYQGQVCKIGGNKIIIQQNGNVIPCELYDDHILGNILSDNYDNILSNREELLNNDDRDFDGKCNLCTFLYKCKGGCKALSINPSISSSTYYDKTCVC